MQFILKNRYLQDSLPQINQRYSSYFSKSFNIHISSFLSTKSSMFSTKERREALLTNFSPKFTDMKPPKEIPQTSVNLIRDNRSNRPANNIKLQMLFILFTERVVAQARLVHSASYDSPVAYYKRATPTGWQRSPIRLHFRLRAINRLQAGDSRRIFQPEYSTGETWPCSKRGGGEKARGERVGAPEGISVEKMFGG